MMILLVLKFIEYSIYTYFCISTIYIVIFSIASFFYKKEKITISKCQNKFAIIIPAYKEDKVIKENINSILVSEYNSANYEIYVISDRMSDETNNYLLKKKVNLLKVNYKDSSKAKALIFCINNIPHEKYNYIIILDADNIISPQYLSKINDFINSTKCKALQTHRKAKNIDNSISMLDAVIEEINNTIFRQGHKALNISSSLIGSGMVFEEKIFRENVIYLNSSGEDKELEEILLRKKIFIDYSKNISFKDEKVKKKNNIIKQRRRWIASHFYIINHHLSHILQEIKKHNIDYCIKTIEVLILPRSILIAILAIICVSTSFISLTSSIKWWVLLLLIISFLLFSIPSYLIQKKILRAICNIPFFILIMIFNLFRIKGASNKFIHTEHAE